MSQLSVPSPEKFQAATSAKVVIITGAAQGIGFAIAEAFATSGAKVVIADLDERLGKAAQDKIGHGALFVKCDVASWSDQARLFQNTVAKFGRVDTVICNAGVNPELMERGKYDFLSAEVEGSEEDGLRPSTKIFDVNFTGVVYGVRLAVNHLRRGGGGRIVVIGSAASYIPVPDQALYCASKHAVLGLVRATSRRRECLESGISISMVAPWLTETRMTSEISKEVMEGIMVSSAHDVASAVSIMATQPLERINGKSIWVQGQTCTEVEDAIAECHGKLML